MASLPKKKIQKKFPLSGAGNGVLNIFLKFWEILFWEILSDFFLTVPYSMQNKNN